MSDFIDITPFIARKRSADCRHEHLEVDDEAASLSCADCGVEIDPWWFIRQLAHDEEGARARREKRAADIQAVTAQGQAAIGRLNETIVRLNAEIRELTEAKNRLWNEQVNGAPLGTQVRRRRRRA